MSIQERDYYKDPYQPKKDKRNILLWIIVIVIISGLILSLIPLK